MTVLSLAPYILVMTTSFIRISITMSFLRTAMGTQQVPPTQVLMAL
ncbi:MAG: flagellar biosynthetic protein FliP, partial [Armatimonadetes bacterium]|nr:flagellar biosynthetic protein FliP [Armatimonadota bacterium]